MATRRNPNRPYSYYGFKRNPMYKYGVYASGAGGLALAAKYGKAAYYAGSGLYSSWAQSKNRSLTKYRKRTGRRMVGVKGRYRKHKNIAKQVKQLSRIAKADQGTLIYRRRRAFRAVCNANESAFSGVALNNITTIETVLAELRYYDPSIPGTLLQAAGSTGTFQKDFFFDLSYHKVICRNNYQTPVKLRVYFFHVKEDSSITPPTTFTNGLADVGNPSNVSSLVYPTDSNQLNEIWKVDKSCNVVLQPGQVKTMSLTNKKFTYDPSISDNHTSSFQRSFAGSYLCFRVEGTICHDSTVTTEQGSNPAGVDIQVDDTWNVMYPAGADIKFIVVNDESDSFTNSALGSNMPASNNQGFSIS